MNTLTYAIFMPFIGMIAVLLTKKDNPDQTRKVGMLFAILSAVLCTMVMFETTNLESGEYAMKANVLWLDLGGRFQVHYAIGADGLSGMLIFLTGLLAVCAAVSS